MTSSEAHTAPSVKPQPRASCDTTVELIAEVAVGFSAMCAIATAPAMPERQARFFEAKRITEGSIDRLKAWVRPKDRRLVFEALLIHGLPSGVATSCVGLLRSEVEPWGKHRSKKWEVM